VPPLARRDSGETSACGAVCETRQPPPSQQRQGEGPGPGQGGLGVSRQQHVAIAARQAHAVSADATTLSSPNWRRAIAWRPEHVLPAPCRERGETTAGRAVRPTRDTPPQPPVSACGGGAYTVADKHAARCCQSARRVELSFAPPLPSHRWGWAAPPGPGSHERQLRISARPPARGVSDGMIARAAQAFTPAERCQPRVRRPALADHDDPRRSIQLERNRKALQ
jgi:hypothetical protein